MSKTDVPVGQRQLRVGEEVRHALAWILEGGHSRSGSGGDPVTVTEVRISPDLRQATVFAAPLGGRDEMAVMAALARAGIFQAANRPLRAPEVCSRRLRIDRSFEQADRIARVLREPEVSRDLRSDGPRNDDKDGDV